MTVITFKEPQDIVVSADTHVGTRSVVLSIPKNFTCDSELDVYGNFADIIFHYDGRQIHAYAIPLECFEIVK